MSTFEKVPPTGWACIRSWKSQLTSVGLRTVLLASLVLFGGSELAQAVTFDCASGGNTCPGTIADGGVAANYPATIAVAIGGNNVTSITVTITGFSAPRPDDIDMLLVAPNGEDFVFWSDVGGTGATTVAGAIIVSDAGATVLPGSTALSAGTFRPADDGGAVAFPGPAPAGPYNHATTTGAATFTTVFVTPNGTWSLYVVDDLNFGGISTVPNWTLDITAAVPVELQSFSVE